MLAMVPFVCLFSWHRGALSKGAPDNCGRPGWSEPPGDGGRRGDVTVQTGLVEGANISISAEERGVR